MLRCVVDFFLFPLQGPTLRFHWPAASRTGPSSLLFPRVLILSHFSFVSLSIINNVVLHPSVGQRFLQACLRPRTPAASPLPLMCETVFSPLLPIRFVTPPSSPILHPFLRDASHSSWSSRDLFSFRDLAHSFSCAFPAPSPPKAVPFLFPIVFPLRYCFFRLLPVLRRN